MVCMIIPMRTTLIIPDQIFRELKRRAAQRRETLSTLVEETLRRGLDDSRASEGTLPQLPVHHLGVPSVDVADRDALWRAMEGR